MTENDGKWRKMTENDGKWRKSCFSAKYNLKCICLTLFYIFSWFLFLIEYLSSIYRLLFTTQEYSNSWRGIAIVPCVRSSGIGGVVTHVYPAFPSSDHLYIAYTTFLYDFECFEENCFGPHSPIFPYWTPALANWGSMNSPSSVSRSVYLSGVFLGGSSVFSDFFAWS